METVAKVPSIQTTETQPSLVMTTGASLMTLYSSTAVVDFEFTAGDYWLIGDGFFIIDENDDYLVWSI